MRNLFISLFFLAILILPGGLRVQAQGVLHPYKKPDVNNPLTILPLLLHPPSDSTLNLFESKEYLWGEVEALLFELHKYNLSGHAKVTDGRTNFEEAERPFMAFVYTGLSICNLSASYPELRKQGKEQTRWILNALQTEALSGFISPHFGPPFTSQPIKQTSVFVHGQILYLAINYRNTFHSTDFDTLIHKLALSLATDFEKNIILPSYRDMWYLSDNIPALAALQHYDRAFGKKLAPKPISAFVNRVKSNYLDARSGLIYSYVNNPGLRLTGSQPVGEAVMYNAIFLPEIDSALAIDQWQKARKCMLRTLSYLLATNKQAAPYKALIKGIGSEFYACLEYPEGQNISDTQNNRDGSDSGPVFLGAGMAASGFALAAANRMKEEDTYKGLEKFAFTLGKPTWVENRLYYINMINPVGQAVILFGKTLRIK